MQAVKADDQRPAAPSTLRLVSLVCALVLVETVFFTALTPLLPHYAHAAGLTKVGVGLLVACYPAGTLVGALPGGVLVALRDPRLAAGMWLMALAGTAFGVVDVLAPLRLSRLGADSGVIATASRTCCSAARAC
jgi:MFS family permease